MALKGFHSGEDTRFPSYATRNTSSSWTKVANQPSRWEVRSNHDFAAMGIDTNLAYTGTTSVRVHSAAGGGGFCQMRRHFGATFTESYLSLMFQVSLLQSRILFTLTDSGGNIAVRVMSDDLGRILVYAGTTLTLKKTIVTGWGASEWHQIRMHMKPSTSTLEIKLDGGNTVDCSGTTFGNWYYIQLCGTVVANSDDVWFDCFQVNDTTGSVNNSWPDTPRIPTGLHPDADTAITDWTRSSGSNDFDMIKELAPDLDSTYVYSNVFNEASRFDFVDLAEPANSVIIGVCLSIVGKRADDAKIVPVVSRGGSSVELTAVTLNQDYMTPTEVIIELDPITAAAWTQTNLNATTFGIKHVAP